MTVESIKTPKGERVRISFDNENFDNMNDAIDFGMTEPSGIAAYVLNQECSRGLKLHTPREYCNVLTLTTQAIVQELTKES